MALRTIPLHGTVAGNAKNTISSRSIDFPFRTKYFKVSFPPGAQRKVRIKLFVSKDQANPTTVEPHGHNLLKTLSDTDYILGDNESVMVYFEEEFRGGNYLKVYANNTDGFSHTIDVVATIEEL